MTINEFKGKLEKNRITLYKTKIENDFYKCNFIEFLEEDDNEYANNLVESAVYTSDGKELFDQEYKTLDDETTQDTTIDEKTSLVGQQIIEI